MSDHNNSPAAAAVTRVEKPWGYEIIWARTPKYVGKVLHINAGHKLSLQFHRVKDETVHVHSGQMKFVVEENGVMTERGSAPARATTSSRTPSTA